jgi:hypothetical protein
LLAPRNQAAQLVGERPGFADIIGRAASGNADCTPWL